MLGIIHCGCINFLIVLMFVVRRCLLLVLRVFGIIFLRNRGIILVSMKILVVGFFGDFELLLMIWNFLFLMIVVIISRRVLIFSFVYIRGLIVGNFILLYLRFIIRIL